MRVMCGTCKKLLGKNVCADKLSFCSRKCAEDYIKKIQSLQ